MASTVKIATYNTLIEHWARNNKPCYNGITWDQRKEGLVERILTIDPDVIALQEVDRFDSFAEAMAKVGYHGVYARRNNHEVEGCALFFKHKTVALVGEKIHYFNDGTGRMIQEVAFKVLGVEHLPITVLNTHLLYTEAQVPGAKNINRTETELKMLQGIAKKLADLSQPVVVCGDFNIPAGAPSLEGFRANGFTDPLESSSAPTFVWQDVGSRIDYTLSKNIAPLSSEVVGDANQLATIKEPSDHLPIVTTYKLPENPAALKDFLSLPESDRNRVYAAFYTLIKPSLKNDYFGVGEKVFLGQDTQQISQLEDLRAQALLKVSH